MDDIIPPSMPPGVDGSVFNPLTPGSYYPPRDDPTDLIRLADECYTDACRRIRADIDASLKLPESEYRKAQAVIEGQINNQLDIVEASYVKMYRKVHEEVERSLSQAYIAGLNLGIPVPTEVGLAIARDYDNPLGANYVMQRGEELVAPDWPVPLLGPNPFADPAEASASPIIAGDTPPPTPSPPATPGGCTQQQISDWVASLEGQWMVGFGFPPDTSAAAICVNDPYGCGYIACKVQQPDGGGGGGTLPPNCHVETKVVCDTGGGGTPPPPVWTQCAVDAAKRLFDVTLPGGTLTVEQAKIVNYVCEGCPPCGPGGPPPPPPPPPPGTTKLKLPNWCKVSVTDDLDNFQTIATDPAAWLKNLLQLQPSTATEFFVPPWLKWAADSKLIPEWAVELIVNGAEWFIDAATEAVKLSNESFGESTTANLFAETVYVAMSALNKWFGFPPKSWLRSLEKTVNWQAPEGIPSAGEAMEGYLNGVFTEELWLAYTKANNLCAEPQYMLLQGRRTRPNVHEVMQLFMQEKITESEWRTKMADLGVIRREEQDEYRKLVDQYPQPPDLIRFMMRDAADEEIVRKYQYDSNFEEKFAGQIRTYAKAVGLSEKEARLYWRAHWEIPSNTQLFEMLHRLRPGRVGKDIEVTFNDVKEAIQINDLAPFWVDRIMATSYHPLTRTDLQAMFNAGTITDAELQQYMMDLGYNVDDAAQQVKFFKRVKLTRSRNLAGLPGPKQILKRYADGLASIGQTDQFLEDFGWDADQRAAGIGAAQRKREERILDASLKGIRSQMLRGQLSKEQANAQMVGMGLDVASARWNSDLWLAERGQKSKLLSGSQLCKAWSRGLLTPEEFQDQLWAAGYTLEDSKRVMSMCGAEVGEKRAKKEEALARKALADQEKTRKELEKIEKRKCAERKAASKGQPPPC
jgi:hypothetical protein